MTQAEERSREDTELTRFAQKALIAVVMAASAVAVLAFLQRTIHVWLLLFAGILLGILLDALRDFLTRYTPLSPRVALGVIVVALLVVTGVAGWLAAPGLVTEIQRLSPTLQQSGQDLQRLLADSQTGAWLLDQLQGGGSGTSILTGMLGSVTGFFSSTFSGLVDTVVILFVGFFVALSPDLYVLGIIHLVPIPQREHAEEILGLLGATLRWWLIGRVAAMFVIGVMWGVGLALLGVPLAFTLGVLAALLSFIPILGPILALIPAVLVGLTISPRMALYVFLLYSAIQFVESYILTPIIQERTVSMSPVVTIMTQVVAGLLLGPLAIALAHPAAAVFTVLINVLYVEDTLGDHEVEVDPTPA